MTSLGDPLRAQGLGQWTEAFDHQNNVPGVATNAEAPYGANGPKWPLRLSFPLDTTTPPPPPVPTMNALHMALIPVGPHRGKVVVWGRGDYNFVASAAPFDPNFWNFEAFSIVDPSISPAGPRFTNFFLPLEQATGQTYTTDLFCAGHAWSPFGYLVVAGGTRYLNPDNGADMVWTFDPRFPQLQFPGSTAPNPFPYADPGSRWLRHPNLQTPRYYPTATLMQRVPRTVNGQPTNVDVMVVFGGSRVAGNPGPEWNHYEALQIADAPGTGAIVVPDDVAGTRTWWGPAVMSNATPALPLTPSWDALVEYPRIHFVNGRLFFAGWAPRSATLDHTFLPTVPLTQLPLDQALPWQQRWDLTRGTPIATSHLRESGSSTLFVNYPGHDNLVLRIGGADDTGTARKTMEGCLANAPGSWTAKPDMVLAREHCNAVILPDASVFVVGGHDGATSHLTPEIYKFGVGWTIQPAAISRRDYHSTAVLLPDGRVLVGGGNNRHNYQAGTGFDYEIFTPPYLVGDPDRPKNLSIPNATNYIPSTDTYELSRAGTFTLVAQSMADDSLLKKLVLIPPGSVTHHSDMHQRYVECTVTAAPAANMLQFTVPSENHAPRGYYMAFAMTSGGIPAEALWVRLL